MSLSTRRYQVASITQNNHVYEDLVKYFRSKISLNLRSQVNVQNASNNISNCLPPDSKPTRFYKTKNPTYLRPIMALTYPKKYKEDIDPTNAKQKDLNGFLLYHIIHYTDSEYNNTIL